MGKFFITFKNSLKREGKLVEKTDDHFKVISDVWNLKDVNI